jgi:hypothetical protein
MSPLRISSREERAWILHNLGRLDEPELSTFLLGPVRIFLNELGGQQSCRCGYVFAVRHRVHEAVEEPAGACVAPEVPSAERYRFSHGGHVTPLRCHLNRVAQVTVLKLSVESLQSPYEVVRCSRPNVENGNDKSVTELNTFSEPAAVPGLRHPGPDTKTFLLFGGKQILHNDTKYWMQGNIQRAASG